MITFNAGCTNCDQDARLGISNQEGYLHIECMSCGDILKVKDVKEKEDVE